MYVCVCTHSFCSLSYDRSIASSKASSRLCALCYFLLQCPVSSCFLKVIQQLPTLLPRLPVTSIIPFLSMYVCVCVYVGIYQVGRYVCMQVGRYVCLYVYRQVGSRFVCMYVFRYVCMYARMCLCVCMYVCKYVCLFVCRYVCMQVGIRQVCRQIDRQVGRQVGMCVCVCVCVCVSQHCLRN